MTGRRSRPPLLEVREVSKSFPGVRALHRVSLRLARGEVLAADRRERRGQEHADEDPGRASSSRTPARSCWTAGPSRLDSVRTAVGHGIALIHQELNLADNLDVGANIFLGREPHRWGVLNRAAIDREAAGCCGRSGLDVSPRTVVSTLPIGQQQLVEIAKALSVNARVLIMDEPTSSLSAEGGGDAVPRGAASCGRAASASSTSRTGWARSRSWPTG